jgi:hypothetical protein
MELLDFVVTLFALLLVAMQTSQVSTHVYGYKFEETVLCEHGYNDFMTGCCIVLE